MTDFWRSFEAGFKSQTQPFNFGILTVLVDENTYLLGPRKQIVVKCALFPDHHFSMYLRPDDIASRQDEVSYFVGLESGKFFAAINNPVPANVCLGEN